MSRVVTNYKFQLVSAKKLANADFQVAVSSDGTHSVIKQKVDPNHTHPFRLMDLISRINLVRTGRKITSYDLIVVISQDNLREDERYAWRHSHTGSDLWSSEALSYFRHLDDASYDAARILYRKARRKTH